jgi:hypothetical protein
LFDQKGKYRADLYSYLNTTAENIDQGLKGNGDLVSNIFFLLSSPDKLIRAAVSEFIHVYVYFICLISIIPLFFFFLFLLYRYTNSDPATNMQNILQFYADILNIKTINCYFCDFHYTTTHGHFMKA